MRNMITGLNTAAALGLTALLGFSASAQQIIYDNTSDFSGLRTEQGSREIGDVVTFAGTDRILVDFEFEYFINPSGNETIQVFFRAMDGVAGGPGTVLYDSGIREVAEIAPDGADFYTFHAHDLNLAVPETITWSVAFNGFEANEGGLLFYNGPTVGTSPRFDTANGTLSNDPSHPDFFYRKSLGSGWEVLTTPDVVDNFAARFTAVPEPSTWALMLGGLGAFGLLRRRK